VADLASLKPDTRNANKGTVRGRALLEDSLRRHGAGRSILADKHGNIIAGNKTLEASADIGLPVRIVQTDGTELVVVQRTDLDLDTEGARSLAYLDNRVAELDLDWDVAELLADRDAGLDLAAVGFDADELAALLAGLDAPAEGLTDPDAVPGVPDEPITKPGDIWTLGRHRLLCGDSTVMANVDRLLGDVKVDAVVTDPPYGVDIAYESFDDTEQNVSDLVDAFMPTLADKGPIALTPGIPAMWFYPRPTWLLAWVHPAAAGSGPWGFTGVNPIIVYGGDPYLKAGMGRRHDYLVLAADREGVEGHPVIKPIKVWEWLVERLTTREGQVVYDPFLGSGTTLIAAEQLGRTCYGMEISPAYCDVIVNRWQDFTGGEAVRA
jgi:hypothetical protein